MRKRFTLTVLILALAMLLSACGGEKKEGTEKDSSAVSTQEETSASEDAEAKDESKDESAAATGAMTPGTYTAKSEGMNAEVEVTVEVTENEIKSVEVTAHQETPGIGGELKSQDGTVLRTGVQTPVLDLPERIVASQSIAVDNITGATISSAAIKNAVKDCLEQAGANPDDWKKEVTYDQNKENMTADVVIVGGGGTGLAAAVSAAEQGKSVIIVEKNGAVGGNTLVCGAIYNTPDEDLQKKVEMTEPVKQTLENALAEEPVNDAHAALQAEVQAQWDEYKAAGRTDLFDSKEWYALQTWINGDKVANLDLVKVLCYQAYDGFKWIEGLGMGYDDVISQGAGSLWERTHTSEMDMGTGFISTYVLQVEKHADKIQVLNETTATDLIMDGEKVAGVKVQDNLSEQAFEVAANDGVIISTGGFSANKEMVQEYNTSGKWDDLSNASTTNRTTVSQGDGIKLALQAKASLTDMDQIQLLYLGNIQDGQLTKYPPRDVNGTDQIIFINKEGKRFVREDGRRDQISSAVLKQTDSIFYMLESGDGAGYVDIKDPNWRSADGFTFDYLKENGFILVADTLEEMAEQLGCKPEDLQATVDTFNASVDSGEDEFGRTLFSTKLENGPWVATPRQACVHHTMGGLTIDTEGRVLNEAGTPIPGLYAGGEVTGGVHGGNRLGGNAVVDTVVFGKLAADTLVKDSQK